MSGRFHPGRPRTSTLPRLRWVLVVVALLGLNGCVAVAGRMVRAIVDGPEPSATPSSAAYPEPARPVAWRSGD